MDSVDDFYASITNRINNLESANNFMSNDFLQRVLYHLRSIHNQLPILAKKLYLPVDEYMTESIRLCAIGDVIKTAVTNMESYYSACLKITSSLDDIHALCPSLSHKVIGAISVCKTQAVSIEEQNRSLIQQRIQPLMQNRSCALLYAMRNVNSLLLTILLNGLVHYLPDWSFSRINGYEGYLFNVPHSHMISTTRLQLKVDQVTGRVGLLSYRRSKSALDELKGVLETEFSHEIVQVESEVRLREIVESLKVCIEVSRDGSKNIIRQLDVLFKEIDEVRRKLSDFGTHP